MKKEIYLAGGCFWGTEHFMKLIEGVTDTQVGFANGHTSNPTYEEVCHNNTGHAETVRVVYDTDKVTLQTLLRLYFKIIDPTSLNRQGEDCGTQYRTGIYFKEDADQPVIDAEIKTLTKQYKKSIVVEVMPLQNFYLAEDYHQDYLDKNPTGYCHVAPELFDLAKKGNKA